MPRPRQRELTPLATLLLSAGGMVFACHSGTTRQLINPEGNDSGISGDSGLNAGGQGGTPGTSGTTGTSPRDDGGDAGGGGSGGGFGGTPGDHGPRDAAADADAQTDPDADVDAGPSCGDGNVDDALDEECDDGNQQHSDGCENDCTKTRIEHLGVGWTYNCALSSGGAVKCWGQDIYGSLGRGTSGADISNPLQVPPLDFGTNRRVVQLSTGYSHACVRFEDNKARCWGRNESGQLGINSQGDYGDTSDEPLSGLADLQLNNVQTITAGRYNTCAIAGTTGLERLYCWGSNIRGEVGLANTSTTPVLDQPASPIELSAQALETIAGTRWVCALLPTAARCWGSFDYGVRGVGATSIWLGDNEIPNSSTYNVKSLPAAPTMLSGRSSTLCALVGGDAYCWGRNLGGEAGYPTVTYGTEIWQAPRAVNLGDVSLVQVRPSANYTCALDDQGFIYCWGDDVDDGAMGYPGIDRIGGDRDPILDYQLMRGGDGGVSDGIDAGPVTPGLPVGAVDLGDFDDTPGPDRATHVETGPDRTCALMEDGTARCWGENSGGQVGYDPSIAYIGLTDSPAQAYEKIGHPDVKIFGPLPTDGGL